MTTNTESTSLDTARDGEEKDLIKGGMVSMDKLLKDSKVGLKIYKQGDAVKAEIGKVMKNKVLVNIDDRISGIIGGKELAFDPQFVKGLKVGDSVTAYVVLAEDDEGRMLLSLRKAGKDNAWANLIQQFNSKETISVVVSEANKGGLMIDMGGLKGFLPVSQLSAEHYPRVEGGDKNEILTKLQQMVGKSVDVKILSIDKNSNKLIFSEREAIGNRDIPKEIVVGDIVEGKVTGIVDFGFFVDVDGIEGLVHISEISWAKVDNVASFVKPGDVLKLKIIDIENSRLSLSLKRLEDDPWKKLVKGFKVGDVVSGTVNRFTPFGAFVKIKSESGDVDALVHISEISSQHINDPKDVLKMGEKKEFKIVSIEPEQHRLSLSLKALEKVEEKGEEKKEPKETKKEIKEEIGEIKEVEKDQPTVDQPEAGKKEKKTKAKKEENPHSKEDQPTVDQPKAGKSKSKKVKDEK